MLISFSPFADKFSALFATRAVVGFFTGMSVPYSKKRVAFLPQDPANQCAIPRGTATDDFRRRYVDLPPATPLQERIEVP